MDCEKSTPESYDSVNLKNILIFSVGFMLLMAAWLTAAGIQPTILNSAQIETSGYVGDGYLSQAIVNGVFALTNLIAPTIVAYVGVRTSLVVGTWSYAVFILSFLYPREWTLYTTSAFIGIGAANVWVANGVYFTRSSTKDTIGKYIGIYWAIMAMGQLFGNAFVFWKFQGMNHIDHETRTIVITSLAGVAIAASVTFMFLGKPPLYEKNKKVDGKKDEKRTSLMRSITQPFRLLTNKHMLLIIPASMYNGLEIAFFTSIYPTSVGFTEAFGGDTRKLVGLAGIVIGVGELIGGLVFGVLVDKYIKSKRVFIIFSSCFVHIGSVVLMYLNLPNEAPLGPTLETSWINPPSIPIAMLCALLLGIGDGCISPQICAAIAAVWPEDPSNALAIHRFFQAAFCATGYFIGTLTGLYNQIFIFFVVTLLGTLTFRINEGLIAKMDQVEYSLKSPVPVVEEVSVVTTRKLSDGSSLKVRRAE